MNTIEKAIALVIVLVFVWVALKKAPTKAYSYRCAVLSLCAVASVAIGGVGANDIFLVVIGCALMEVISFAVDATKKKNSS